MHKETDLKKVSARAAFSEFTASHFQREFGQIPPDQLHEGLLRFYIEEIHNRRCLPIDEDDFKSGHVNGRDDLGVDFIHKEDDTVLIVQAKYKSSKGNIEQIDVLHFQSIFDRLINPDFKKNRKLSEALAEVDFNHDRFILKFVSFGKFTDQSKEQTAAEVKYPISDLDERVEYQFLSEEDLSLELRDARALANGTTGVYEFVTAGKRGDKHSIIEIQDSQFPSVVIVVSAHHLVSLFSQYKSALFTLNIRNYLGNTATNKAIISTLKQEPSQFYYYNNGISCLAEKLQTDGDRVTVTGLQIINGAQTVRALHSAARDKPTREAMKDAMVLVRITQAKTQYGAEGKFRDSIVRYNNTQNVIKLSDFKSNDPIQEDLRRKFADIRRIGKVVTYLPKRTDPRDNRSSCPIAMEEFAKVVYSFLRDPVSFSAKTSFLFDDSEAGGYRHVFGDGSQVFTIMPEEEFRLRAAIWWIAEAFGKRLKQDREVSRDPIDKAAIERKWFVLFVARLVLERTFQGKDYKQVLRKYYRGDWQLGVDSVGRWMEELYTTSKEALIFRYSESTREERFVHRNWMRNPKTVELLTEYVKRAPKLGISTHPE